MIEEDDDREGNASESAESASKGGGRADDSCNADPNDENEKNEKEETEYCSASDYITKEGNMIAAAFRRWR